MALSEDFLGTEDLHPIDIVESLAEERDWDFDRIADVAVLDELDALDHPTPIHVEAGDNAIGEHQ